MSRLTDGQLLRLSKAVQSNKDLKLARIKQYELNQKRCWCGNPLSYQKRHNKFCSHSCAAAFNNKGQVRNFVSGKYSAKHCFYCDKVTDNNKYCSKKCFESDSKENRIERFLNGECISHSTIKKCLIDIKGEKCEVCGITEWRGLIVPLVADHINGNPSDNRPENFRLVCGNCNMQLPTFAGRNVGKGGGRPYRNQRYREGKSY